MPDEPQGTPAAVPDGAGTSPAPAQTPAAPPAQAPAYLTKDDAAALVQDRLSQLETRLAEQLGNFASREDLRANVNRATDQGFARLMKKLAPEMRGIDKAVQMGHMDPEAAKHAKAELLTDAASKMDTEDEAPPPPPPAAPPAPAPPPAPPKRNEASMAADKLLAEAGMTWDDVRKETDAFKASQGRDIGLSEFTLLVARKQAEKMVEGKKADWMKEYEAKTGKVKESDQAGATVPPPQGAQPEYKPKATLEDANDVGEVLADKFGFRP